MQYVCVDTSIIPLQIVCSVYEPKHTPWVFTFPAYPGEGSPHFSVHWVFE